MPLERSSNDRASSIIETVLETALVYGPSVALLVGVTTLINPEPGEIADRVRGSRQEVTEAIAISENPISWDEATPTPTGTDEDTIEAIAEQNDQN